MAASSCQQNNTSKLGRLDLRHQEVVILALPYSQILWHSDSVHKGTKANKALTGNSVLVSAVLAESTSTVMVMQKIPKLQLVYFKLRGARQGPRKSFTVGLTRLEGSGRTWNGWPKVAKLLQSQRRSCNWVVVAFILKGIPRWRMWWCHTTCAIYHKFGKMHLTSHTGQHLLAKAQTDVFWPVTAKLHTGLGCNQGQQPWLPMPWYLQCIKVAGQFQNTITLSLRLMPECLVSIY